VTDGFSMGRDFLPPLLPFVIGLRPLLVRNGVLCAVLGFFAFPCLGKFFATQLTVSLQGFPRFASHWRKAKPGITECGCKFAGCHPFPI